MADQTVKIENVGGNGVASEATLRLLLKTMEKCCKGDSTKAKQTTDAVKNYHQQLTSGIKVITKNRDALNKHTDAVEDSESALRKLAKGGLSLFSRGLGIIWGSITGLTETILTGGNSIEEFARHVPIVGSLFADLGRLLDREIKLFRELTTVGVDFGGSIINLRNAATESGLSMQSFQTILRENSKTLSLFAGSATEGARRFRDISGIVQQQFAPDLLKLGATFEELGEFTSDYISLQTRLGRAQTMTDQQLALGTNKYVKQLDLLSRITGKRRDEIAEELQQQMNDRRIRALVSVLSEDQARTLQNVTASIENADLKEAITELVATGGVPLQNELARSIARMTPALAEASAKLKEGTITEEEFFEVLRQGSVEMNEFLRENGDQASVIAAVGNSAFDAAFALQGLESIGSEYAETVDEQQQALADQQRAMLSFEASIQAIRNEIIGALIDTGIFQLVEQQMGNLVVWIKDHGLPVISSAVEYFSSLISGIISDIQEKGFMEVIKEQFESLDEYLENGVSYLFGEDGILVDALSGVGSFISDALLSALTNPIVLASIAGIFAAPMIMSALVGGIGTMFSSLLSTGGGGSQGPGRGQGPGTGPNRGASIGRNVGGFAGGIAGGVLEGAASGLRAFSDPRIIAGAAILSGSIVLIGGAVAGATWMLGSALPTFAEGMKSFEDVDGEKIRLAATGMLAMSAALAAFGAATVVSGIGNVVGVVLDGFANLFGGEDPMEKMQRFASYDIDVDKVENNSRAMVAFSTAMAAQGAGSAASGIGNFIGGVLDGITSFFGGDVGIPYDKIREFSNADLGSPEGIQSNSEIIIAFNRAMQNLPSDFGEERSGGFLGWVAGTFAGDVEMPYNKIRNFSNADLGSPEGIQSNSEILVAFNRAMQNLPSDFGEERSGGFFGWTASIFAGDVEMPYNKIRNFSNADLGSPEGIQSNSEILVAFNRAMQNLPNDFGEERSGGFFGWTASIFAGDVEMPYDKIRQFSNADLGNFEGIQTNSEILVAFNRAIQNFPRDLGEERSGGFFGWTASVFAGDVEMPYDKIREFSNADLGNLGGIQTNSEILVAFNRAIQNFPRDLGEERSGGFFGWTASVFAGDVEMPWDKIREFGQVDLGNGEQVIRNAEIMSQFGLALSSFDTSAIGDLMIDPYLVRSLESISEISGTGFQLIADSMTSIAGISGLETNFGLLTSLDPENISDYNDSMEDLVETLKELNSVLAEDNLNWRGQGTGVGAADVLQQINTSSSGNSEQLAELNNIMTQILNVLTEQSGTLTDNVRATRSLSNNLLQGF